MEKNQKAFVDLYEQFIDHDYYLDHHPKAKETPKKRTWTPEDQVMEDILWAS